MCQPTQAHVKLAGAMRDLRAFVDVGQERVAARMGCSRSRLSHFETAADLPNPSVWRRWSDAIEQAGRAKQRDAAWHAALTAKLVDANRLRDRAVAESAGTQDRPVSGPSPQQPSMADVPLVPQWVPTARTGRDIHTDVSALQGFRAADRHVGGGHLYPTVVSYLHTSIGPRLFGGQAHSRGDGLFTVAASMTEMAGWLAHDAGNDSLAEAHFARARDLAAAAGDQQLAAHIMASMSHLALHMNDPGTAMGLARQGHAALSGTSRNPELEARLLAMQARGAAATGDAADCAQLLMLAEQVLDQQASEAPSAWISGFDHASLASEAARCLRHLGDVTGGRQQAERILTMRTTRGTRSRAFGQLILASVLIAEGDPEHGCAVAVEVVDATTALASYPVSQELDGLRAPLAGYRANRAVAAFLASLDDITRRRSWFAKRSTEPTTQLPGLFGTGA
jgi:hypothetical protein